jgi:hypothetical protein
MLAAVEPAFGALGSPTYGADGNIDHSFGGSLAVSPHPQPLSH